MSLIPGIAGIRKSVSLYVNDDTQRLTSILDQCPEMEADDDKKLAYMVDVGQRIRKHDHGMSSQQIADNTLFWNKPLQLILDAVDSSLATPRNNYVIAKDTCTPIDDLTFDEMKAALLVFITARNKRGFGYPTAAQCLYGTESGQPDTDSAWTDDDEDL